MNSTGRHGTAYFDPVELRDIRIDLPRAIGRVRAVALGQDLPVTTAGTSRSVTLPRLGAYEVLLIE